MADNLPWVVVLAISVTHIAASLWQTIVLLRARIALKPPPEVLPGRCAYRAQSPELGQANQWYCRNYLCNRVLGSKSECESCTHRQLPMPDGRFFDHVELAEWPPIVLRQLVSLSVGVVTMLYTVVRLSAL